MLVPGGKMVHADDKTNLQWLFPRVLFVVDDLCDENEPLKECCQRRSPRSGNENFHSKMEAWKPLLSESGDHIVQREAIGLNLVSADSGESIDYHVAK